MDLLNNQAMGSNELSADTSQLDQAIGQVVRLAGMVEWWLRELYGVLLCSPHATLVAPGMQVRQLTEAVRQLAVANHTPQVLSHLPRRPISDELHHRIRQAMRDVDKLFEERNSVVHGMWGLDASGRSEHVVLRARRWQPQDEWIALSTEKLDGLADRFVKALGEVQQTAVAVSEVPLAP